MPVIQAAHTAGARQRQYTRSIAGVIAVRTITAGADVTLGTNVTRFAVGIVKLDGNIGASSGQHDIG
ncbi:hypothetical protein D3C80_2058770 [compost metagenome]